VSHALPLPVGSAKFGPRVGARVGEKVGANVGAAVGTRVGGLVSPTLVGAGVPVGTRVGAAHAIKRAALVAYSDQPAAAVHPEHRRVRFTCTRYAEGYERTL
jgi:hypothetical protein